MSLDLHTVFGGRHQVLQDHAYGLLGGRHAQVNPPSGGSLHLVELPVADAVADDAAIPPLRQGSLVRHRQTTFRSLDLTLLSELCGSSKPVGANSTLKGSNIPVLSGSTLHFAK